MKSVWLTIDDGPVSDQSERLNLLERHGIKAVWFCLGENLSKHRPQALEILHRGHWLANHSWDHPSFSAISLEEAKRQILVTDRLLQEIHDEAGVPWVQKLFRFPYVDEGGFRDEVGAYLRSLGYRAGRWEGLDQSWWFQEGRDAHPWTHATFDSQDWGLGEPEGSPGRRNTKQVVDRLVEKLSMGQSEIVVAHAWVPLETTTAFIECLAQSGRRFLLPEGTPA